MGVDTMAVDTDTTEARGPLMPNPKPKLTLLPPLKPKLMPMLTTDAVDTMAVDTMDTVDTGMADTDTAVDTVDTMAVDTDTTVARGPLNLPLKPKLHPKLMLTTDTADTAVDTVDTTAVDTDTADTVMAVDTDIMVELLLKQTNKTLKLQLSGSSHSKFFQFGYNAKIPSPYFFLKHENSLFFPIELESKSNVS